MQLKVFALLLTIIYVVSCESHMNTEVENEAQMEQRSQEINSLSEEIINEEPIVTSDRTSDGSQTAYERTQILLAINPNPKPTTQVQEQRPAPPKVNATQNRPQPVVAQPPQKENVTYQRPQPVKEILIAEPVPQELIITHQNPQPVQEIIVAQSPQKVNVTDERPQPVQVIVTQPAPHPIPETHGPTQPPRCVFLSSEGTCANVPSFFTCIREGGILAPDIVRCSWIQACCIRNFLG